MLVRFGHLILVSLCVWGCSESSAPEGESDTVSDTTVYVYIDDDARQCEQEPLALDIQKGTLLEAGVQVYDAQCAELSKMAVATMCGLKTLGVHVFEIAASDQKRARSLGYEAVDALQHMGEAEQSYELRPCPERVRQQP